MRYRHKTDTELVVVPYMRGRLTSGEIDDDDMRGVSRVGVVGYAVAGRQLSILGQRQASTYFPQLNRASLSLKFACRMPAVSTGSRTAQVMSVMDEKRMMSRRRKRRNM